MRIAKVKIQKMEFGSNQVLNKLHGVKALPVGLRKCVNRTPDKKRYSIRIDGVCLKIKVKFIFRLTFVDS